MSEVIGQLLPLAIGVSISPIPIIAVVVMLGTPRAGPNGVGFLIGWLAGLLVISVAVLLLAHGTGTADNSSSSDSISWFTLALGILLAGVALRQWRSRPRGEGDGEPKLPSWITRVDQFGPAKATAAGFGLAALNPKNLILTAGAAAAIAQASLDTGEEAACIVIFSLIATIGPGIPVAAYLLMRDRATHMLAEVKDWMALHNAAIMAVICALIAAKLIGDALPGIG